MRIVNRSPSPLIGLALLLVLGGGRAHASPDTPTPGDACGSGSVCHCDPDAEASDFERAILTALQGQSTAVAGIAAETQAEAAELWRIGNRLERIALRIVEARTAYYGSLSCGGPGTHFEAAVDLMSEALREVDAIDGIVANSSSDLSAQARTKLRATTGMLRKDLDVEPAALAAAHKCGGVVEAPCSTGTGCSEGQACVPHRRRGGCVCGTPCP